MDKTRGAGRIRAILLVAVTVALVAFLLIELLPGDDNSDSAPELAKPSKAWKPVKDLPAEEPEQLYASGGLLEVDLRPQRRTVEVSGAPILAKPWGESLIGPTMHVSPGDTLRVNLTNSIEHETNIHYHGMHVSPKGTGDNVFRSMAPGEAYESEIEIPADHATGTFWYHAHFHGKVQSQIAGGLTGLLIVEGLEDKLPEDLREVEQKQVILRSIQTTADGKGVETSPATIDPSKPSVRLTNGFVRPKLDAIAPGEVQLWRLGNIDANLFFDVELQDHTFTVLAEDGNPGWETYERKHLVIPPGKRFDVLVRGAAEPGTYDLITRHYDEGFELLPRATLARLPVEGSPGEEVEIPQAMALADRPALALDDATIAERREFDFSFGQSKSGKFEALINGEMFDPSKIDVVPVLGTVEQWRLVNKSNEDHPFHIHINDFQVMSVNDKPYDAHGLQDVVVIPKNGGNVVIRNPFADFTGEFVFHCHIVGHEDAGMMQSVEVVGSEAEARQTQQIDQGTAHDHSH